MRGIRVDYDDVTFFEVVHKRVQVGEVEPAAGVVVTLDLSEHTLDH